MLLYGVKLECMLVVLLSRVVYVDPFTPVSILPSMYLRFLSDAGGVIADSSGNGNTLSVTDTGLATGPHANFAALDLTPTDIARTANSVVAQSTSWALSAWIKFDAAGSNFSTTTVIDGRNGAGSVVRNIVNRSAGILGGRFIPGNITVWSLSAWHHVFIHEWVTGGTLNVKVWFDGVVQFIGMGVVVVNCCFLFGLSVLGLVVFIG